MQEQLPRSGSFAYRIRGKGREDDCMAATALGSLAAFPPSVEVRS